MPGLTGLQFIQSMTEKPMIILITAYEKYALEGFNLDVTDYLVKPVSLDRFVKACNKAKELYELKNRTNKDGPSNPDYFFVNVDYSLLKINFNDIRYIEGLKDYIKIHLKSSSRAIITRMAMKAIEEELPVAKFLRIHKSYIVSLEHITAIRKNSVFLDEMELPVGENFREAVLNLTGRQD
jgi:DNA-binding LytR/AlgR family response regulator